MAWLVGARSRRDFLSPAERRTLTHLAAALLEDAPLPLGPDEVAANVERFLVLGASPLAWRVRAMLRAIELSPLLVGHARPFSRLALHEQRAIVRRHLVEGRGIWRLLARSRYLVLVGAYGDPRAANAETGFVAIPDRPRFRARAS